MLSVDVDCKNLLQGDVVRCDAIWYETADGTCEKRDTPDGIVIISQTCDIVQASKTRILIAPVIPADKSKISSARKGRKPLHLYVEDQLGSGMEFVADLECTTSIPKERIIRNEILARGVEPGEIVSAARFAERLSRVYSRHAFPDEIPPIFSKFREKIQSKADGSGYFSQVLDMVTSIRVSYFDEGENEYSVTVFFIVEDRYWLEPERANKQVRQQSLNKVCEQIVRNQKSADTALAESWSLFEDSVFYELFEAQLGGSVTDVEIRVTSDRGFSFRDYLETVSLDLDVLSHSSF